MSRQRPLKADSTVGTGCRVKCLFNASATRAVNVLSPPPSSSPRASAVCQVLCLGDMRLNETQLPRRVSTSATEAIFKALRPPPIFFFLSE